MASLQTRAPDVKINYKSIISELDRERRRAGLVVSGSRPPARARAAARQRRWRRRQKQGEVVLKISINEHALAGALIVAGHLDEADAVDRARLEAKVGELLSAWTKRLAGAG
jgi:hypothetical protein